MKVHEALSAVMADVRAVAKDGKVDIERGPKFNFRGVDHVVNAVGPVLRQHGCSLRPTSVLDKQYREFETKGGGVSHHCTVEVEYTFTGPEGDALTCTALGEAADYGDKATAKAMAVAWRIAQIQLFCLPTDEPDPDEHIVERAAPEPIDPAKAAWRALRVETASRFPAVDDDLRKQIAQKAWDACGKDPKRLTEMFDGLEAAAGDLVKT